MLNLYRLEMNSSAILNSTLYPEQPFYTILLNYFVIPLVLGNFLDVGFTKLIGSQNCSFDGKERVCNIAGSKIPAYGREALRSLLQLLVVFLILRAFSTYFKNTLYPIFGLGIFLYSQTDLFEDFRRLINSFLFMIKHN
jgi:hypothetical protein